MPFTHRSRFGAESPHDLLSGHAGREDPCGQLWVFGQYHYLKLVRMGGHQQNSEEGFRQPSPLPPSFGGLNQLS